MKWTTFLCALIGLTLRPGPAHTLAPNATGFQQVQVSAAFSAEDVIAQVNALRAEKGLPPYEVNPILMTIARAHAEFMASSGVMTHFGADGARPYQRAIAAGYSVDGDLTLGGFFSENIGAGPDLLPSEVIVNWEGDSLHLNTMISADLKDVGVGVVDADGMTFYVLDAGASTGKPVITPSSLSAIFTTTPGTPAALVVTSTALENGNVFHIVQSNEALWSIALAYDLTVEELKRLNQLSSNDIFIGQKLLIDNSVLSTPTVEPTITVTLGIPTSTATRPVTPTRTFTPTPRPAAPASRRSGEVVVGGIVVAALVAAAVGAWLGRRRSG